MKRILITGKTSFIGAALAAHLAACGDEYAVDMLSVRGENWKNTDFSAYDCVVHAAGKAHVGYRDEMRDEYMAVNRDLAFDVARRARDAGAGQFIFLSSIIVYGPAAPGGKTLVVTRDTAPAPENAYGLSKLEAEQAIARLADGAFRVAILRLPMVYGRGSRGNYSLLMKYARYLPVFPGACGRRSAIYVENLAEYIRALIEKGADGTFFPRDPEPVTTPGMLKAIRGAMGKRTRIVSIFNPLIRLAGKAGAIRRIFGGIEYDISLSPEISEISMYTLDQAVRREATK